jgi:hypothetical protein
MKRNRLERKNFCPVLLPNRQVSVLYNSFFLTTSVLKIQILTKQNLWDVCSDNRSVAAFCVVN